MQSGSTKGNKYPPGYAGGIFVSTFYQAVALSLFASGLREFQSEGAEAVEAAVLDSVCCHSWISLCCNYFFCGGGGGGGGALSTPPFMQVVGGGGGGGGGAGFFPFSLMWNSLVIF